MIKALAASITVALALAACATPVQRTASGDIPPARVYIKSMTEQAEGLSRVQFQRPGGLLNNDMLELTINDVTLAQIIGGEHLTIWLKPGSYDLGAKRVHTLSNSSSTSADKLTLQVRPGASYQLQVGTDLGGVKIRTGTTP